MQDLPREPEIYTAGQMAPPGRYVRRDVYPPVEVILDQPGILPASLDGHVAIYERAGSAIGAMEGTSGRST